MRESDCDDVMPHLRRVYREVLLHSCVHVAASYKQAW